MTFLIEKLAVPKPVNKFSTFYKTWKFITAFTIARHMSLSRGRQIKSTPSHVVSVRRILILSSHLCRGVFKWYLSFRLPHQNHLLVSFYLDACYMPCPSLTPSFDHQSGISRMVCVCVCYCSLLGIPIAEFSHRQEFRYFLWSTVI